MTPAQPNSEKSHGLIVSPSTSLAKLSDGSSSALTEIIRRSLLHIQTSRDLIVPARRAGEECEFEIAPGVKIVMCWIPPGEFLMGSSEARIDRGLDETQHLVKITQGFWLSRTPITQEQWQAVTGDNPSHFEGNSLPVEQVSWEDICGDEGRAGGFLEAVNKYAVTGWQFDLPTEAQWEYACRAGSGATFSGDLDEVAWTLNTSDGKTQVVGQKRPNAWGLYDMLGNVWEWCVDYYSKYDISMVDDPSGPLDAPFRVMRGGCWRDSDCRASIRGSYYPPFAENDIGFRLLCKLTTFSNDR